MIYAPILMTWKMCVAGLTHIFIFYLWNVIESLNEFSNLGISTANRTRIAGRRDIWPSKFKKILKAKFLYSFTKNNGTDEMKNVLIWDYRLMAARFASRRTDRGSGEPGHAWLSTGITMPNSNFRFGWVGGYLSFRISNSFFSWKDAFSLVLS